MAFILGSFFGVVTFSAPSDDGSWAATAAYDPDPDSVVLVVVGASDSSSDLAWIRDDLRGVVLAEAVGVDFLPSEAAEDFLWAAE